MKTLFCLGRQKKAENIFKVFSLEWLREDHSEILASLQHSKEHVLSALTGDAAINSVYSKFREEFAS